MTPDKRRAMLVYLRDYIDNRMQACGAMVAGLDEAGRADRGAAWLQEQKTCHALHLIMACLLAEYDQGLTGQHGVPRAVTSIISAGESAYSQKVNRT